MKSSSCTRVRRHLSDYLDDRLSVAPARAVSLHLAVCDDCRAEHDALLWLSHATAAMPLDAPAPGLADRVRRGRRPAAWRTSVAAGLLIIGGAAGAYALGLRHGARTALTPEVLVRAVDEPRVESVLPADGIALRAARSLLADLELLDDVPIDLHEPILRPQVERYDLAQWAESRRGDLALRPVTAMIQELDRSLDGGLEPYELASLRSDPSRDDVWAAAPVANASRDVVPRDLDELLDRHCSSLSPATRRSLDEWMTFKDEWIRGDEDMTILSGLIDDLAPTLPQGVLREFAFPDLGDIYERLEWSEDEDGVRHGRLDVEQRTPGGMSILRIEVRTSQSRGGGDDR